MAHDQEDVAIVRLYVERGARRYDAILPRPVVTFLSASLAETYPFEQASDVLAALRSPHASRPAEAPVADPPRLPEAQERILEGIDMPDEVKRRVRGLIAGGFVEEVAANFSRRLDWFEEQVDAATSDLIVAADHRAGILLAYIENPAGADREACDRSVTRWVDVSFAGLLAGVMAQLATPGDLARRRIFFPAVHAFRSASRRLLPGDRAIFATYYRDHEGFIPVAARRNVTRDEEVARHEGFLERLAAALAQGAQEAQAPMTLAEGQEALAWLVEWIGRPEKRAVH